MATKVSIMNQTVQATYDGKVLKPDDPLALHPNTRVRILILPTEGKVAPKPYAFFEFAKSANINGPKDWSSRLHDYLYNSENKL